MKNVFKASGTFNLLQPSSIVDQKSENFGKFDLISLKMIGYGCRKCPEIGLGYLYEVWNI